MHNALICTKTGVENIYLSTVDLFENVTILWELVSFFIAWRTISQCDQAHWGEPLHKLSIQYNSKILWLKWFIYATDSKKLKKSGKCRAQIRNSGNPEIRIRFPEKNLTQNFHKIRF